MPERYEAIEVDGHWYVMDHRHPEYRPAKCKDHEDAHITARVFNLLTSAGIEKS